LIGDDNHITRTPESQIQSDSNNAKQQPANGHSGSSPLSKDLHSVQLFDEAVHGDSNVTKFPSSESDVGDHELNSNPKVVSRSSVSTKKLHHHSAAAHASKPTYAKIASSHISEPAFTHETPLSHGKNTTPTEKKAEKIAEKQQGRFNESERHKDKERENDSRLYVSNIPFAVSEDTLKLTFSKFGEVKAVDTHSVSKGYCFIDYGTREGMLSALRAAKEAMITIDNRTLVIEERKGKYGRRSNYYSNYGANYNSKTSVNTIPSSNFDGKRQDGRRFQRTDDKKGSKTFLNVNNE